MTTDDDEIKVGDTVELHDALGRLEVLATNRPGGRWLWVYSGDRPPFTISTDDCRKVKPPTPCPEGWANVYPEFISWHSTKEAAVSSAARRCIGVLHLLPSGDTEFIRTEEL